MCAIWWQALIKAVDNIAGETELEIPSGRLTQSAQMIFDWRYSQISRCNLQVALNDSSLKLKRKKKISAVGYEATPMNRASAIKDARLICYGQITDKQICGTERDIYFRSS